MANTATLRTHGEAHFAYGFFVDGLPYYWVTHVDLEGTTWIGAADGRTGKRGLQIDGLTIELGIDLARTGMLDDSPISVELIDHDGSLVSMMGSFDGTDTPLSKTIDPGDAGVGAGDNQIPAAVAGSHVGIEFIKSDGTRHEYPWYPSWGVGLQHLGEEYEHPGLAPAPVSDSPILFSGRRCGLYRIYRDHVTYPPVNRASTAAAQWRPWSEADLVWWGTVRDAGRVDGKRWEIECDGPESLLRKDLGRLSQAEAFPVVATPTLLSADGQNERKIGIRIWSHDDGGDFENHGEDAFASAFTGDDPDTWITEFKTALAAAVVAAPGVDGSFKDPTSTEFHGAAIFDAGSREMSVRIKEDPINSGWLPNPPGTDERRGVVRVYLHEKVWLWWGYNPPEQKKSGKEYDAQFQQVLDPTVNFPVANTVAVPAAGYWYADFDTASWDDPFVLDNGGAWKVFKPVYPGGKSVLPADLNSGEGQVVTLSPNDGPHIASGQLDRPPFSDPDDDDAGFSLPNAGAVDRQGLWLIHGKYRFNPDDEPEDHYRVARCSWRKGALGTEPQVLSGEMVISEWLNPKAFGLPGRQPNFDWAADSDVDSKFVAKAVPLHTLSYKAYSWADDAEVVLQRLMLTTGTSTGWTGFSAEQGVTLDPGDNDTLGALLPFLWTRDAEIADLGLGIPEGLLQSITDWGKEADKLPPDLRRVKIAFLPGQLNAWDVIQGILQPCGWALSLKGGQYGIFSPWDTVDPDDVDATITQSEKATDHQNPASTRTKQELRALMPIDKFKLELDWNPLEAKHTRSVSVRSSDRGALYRTGDLEQKHKAIGHRTIYNLTGWVERVNVISRWWEKRHFWLKGYPVLRRNPGQDLWPGSRVRITDPRPANQDGTYGITDYVGIVTRVREPLGFDGFVARFCDILVQADSAQATMPRHAPSAQLGRGYDSGNSRIYIKDDWLGLNDSVSDASKFSKGASMSGTGNIECKALQWNGSSWAATCTFDVTGYDDSTSGDHYLTITNFSGAYDRDSPGYVVPQDYDAQGASWVTTNFGAIGNASAQTPGAVDVAEWVK